jgi:hypothetical protein
VHTSSHAKYWDFSQHRFNNRNILPPAIQNKHNVLHDLAASAVRAAYFPVLHKQSPLCLLRGEGSSAFQADIRFFIISRNPVSHRATSLQACLFSQTISSQADS